MLMLIIASFLLIVGVVLGVTLHICIQENEILMGELARLRGRIISLTDQSNSLRRQNRQLSHTSPPAAWYEEE